MPYRNLPRLALGVLSLVSVVAAVSAAAVYIGAPTDDPGEIVQQPLLALALCIVFAVGFVTTGTGWLILRGVGYEVWYRSTHPDEPLHEQRDRALYEAYLAAERDPNS